MRKIDDIAALEAIYGPPSRNAVSKVTPRITPLYRKWIDASRFCILSTVGPEGTDATPRGDDGPVARIVDDTTLWLPDWQGNNRIDSLRNIVRDGRVSLMFMVPGSDNVVRVNGTAAVTADAAATGTFSHRGKHPRCVVVICAGEIYFQCAKAVMRAGLWTTRETPAGLPTAGAFIREQDDSFNAESYDTGYEDYARPRLW